MITAITHTSGRPAPTGALLALASMTCVQLGLAASVGLLDRVGAEGAAWLRLSWAGVIVLLVLRPRPWTMSRRALGGAVLLGAVTGGLTILFMAAVARIPLGTASAIEFLGPLGVAVARGRGGRALAWPALAAIGVLLLTQPWHGDTDLVGIAFALAAAVCWAGYILLTQAVGDELEGLQGLAISLPVAGLVSTVVAGPRVVESIEPGILLAGLGLALLLPVVPFSLEMLALRRLDTAAFGTLMSLEPAIALVVGFALLGQRPDLLALVGIGFVVTAGVGAERIGARQSRPVEAGAVDPHHQERLVHAGQGQPIPPFGPRRIEFSPLVVDRNQIT